MRIAERGGGLAGLLLGYGRWHEAATTWLDEHPYVALAGIVACALLVSAAESWS